MNDVPLRFEGVRLPDWPDGEISLDVAANTAAAVLGSDNSGVGVLVSMALGLTAPSEGRVLVHGQALAALPDREALAARRKLGYLPSGNGLIHNLSLADNVALPLRFGTDLADGQIRRRVEVIMAQLGLTAFASLRPATATVEQCRRAALARAVAFDPDLVLLEQPFNGLTDRAAAELLELARGGELTAGSRRTVFVTGAYLPPLLRPRLETRYRLVRGRLEPDEG